MKVDVFIMLNLSNETNNYTLIHTKKLTFTFLITTHVKQNIININHFKYNN